MTVQLFVDNKEIPVSYLKFSDGSSTLKLDVCKDFLPARYVSLSVHPSTPVDTYLWEILCVASALAELPRQDHYKTHLHLPYLPHGRADRAFESGNPNCLQVFLYCVCNLFDEISIKDPHSNYYKRFSEVTSFNITPQELCFMDTNVPISSGDLLVSPDKGAKYKTQAIHNKLRDYRGITTLIANATKVRDASSGKIIETVIDNAVDYKGKTCYIVDDICDGGGTFIALAEKLLIAGAKEVNLYVTHGIFAKGLAPFAGLINSIYCHQVVGKYVNDQNILDYNRGV